MSDKKTYCAIGWMIASCLCWALMALLMHIVMQTLDNVFVVAFWVDLVSLLVVVVWFWCFKPPLRRPARYSPYVWRAIAGVGCLLLWILAIEKISLSHVTALQFTAPIFTVLLAIMLAGERMVRIQVFALLLGFLGVLLVVYHGNNQAGSDDGETNAFLLGAVYALLSALCWGVVNILVKHVSRVDGQGASLLYSLIAMLLMTVPLAVYAWQLPSMIEIGWLVLIGIANCVGLFCIYRAYHMADLTILMPYDFCTLVFVAILEYIFRDYMVGVGTLLGGGVILAAAYINTRYLQLAKQKERNGTAS